MTVQVSSLAVGANAPQGVAQRLAQESRTRHRNEKGFEIQNVRVLHRSYRVFTAPETEKTLIWHPVPKNASTSLKFAFAKACGLDTGYSDYDDIPIHQQTRLGCFHDQYSGNGWHRTLSIGFPTTPIHNFVLSSRFIPYPVADERICVLRDPIERFLALYADRIVRHREIEFISLNEAISKYSENCEKLHDLHPQHWFLGEDAGYYTRLFSMRQIPQLQKFLEEFFGEKFNLGSMQKGIVEKPEPNAEQRKALERIFARDYEIYGDHL